MEVLRQWLKDWLAEDRPADNAHRRPGFSGFIYGSGRSHISLQKEQIEINYQGQRLAMDIDHARFLLEDLADALGMGSFMVPAPVPPARWAADEIVSIADKLLIDNRYLAVTTAMKIYEMGEK